MNADSHLQHRRPPFGNEFIGDDPPPCIPTQYPPLILIQTPIAKPNGTAWT
jgi:hypothetical protein